MNYNHKIDAIRESIARDEIIQGMMINNTDMFVYILFASAVVLAVSFPFIAALVNIIKEIIYRRKEKND